MSELRMFEEEITPEEEAITPSFQPSPEMEISPEAETCESFFGGALRVCLNINVAAKKIKVTAYLLGQRIGRTELTQNDLTKEVSANLGVVKGSAKVTVNWNAKKVTAKLKHCKKRWVGLSLRWSCSEKESTLARW